MHEWSSFHDNMSTVNPLGSRWVNVFRKAHRKQEQRRKCREKFKRRAQSVEEMQKYKHNQLDIKFAAVVKCWSTSENIKSICSCRGSTQIIDFPLKGWTSKPVHPKVASQQRAQTHSETGLKLLTAAHSSDAGVPLRGLLPAYFVKRSRGKLGSVGDMLRGLHQERQASRLKRRARMCRSCFCELMFARWACLLTALTAATAFMNYSVLTSVAAEMMAIIQWVCLFHIRAALRWYLM